MSLSEFKSSPWARSHPSYRGAALAMNPAPEYANSEVLVASLYRTISSFSAEEEISISEGRVPIRGRELERSIVHYRDHRDRGRKPNNAALDGDSVHALLHNVLESPKLPNQSTKRFLQVTPLVGETASFSGSARLAGNPWPAGALVRQMVWLGSADSAAAQDIWSRLFHALGVHDDDDVFARFLRDEVSAWTSASWGIKLAIPDGEEAACLPHGELDGLASPARQFCEDLDAVLAAKSVMTRRQWTSLLEALIRIAAVGHVAWVCEVHRQMWECVRQALAGVDLPDDLRATIYPRSFGYLTYGMGAVSELKDRTSTYLAARLGLNAVLWSLDECGVAFPDKLSSAESVAALCALVKKNRGTLAGVSDDLDDLSDREARTLLCRKGVGSNVMEFARHVLYQRQVANSILRGYDQGYVLRKRSAAKSSPWICAPGPVAILVLVHCSLAKLAGPRSVHRLAQHMAAYGIVVDHRKIDSNELGAQLRMLGLVLDSPDAESGMLLVPPFPQARPLRESPGR
ncbi:hypothetical protein [Mesorhizobium sp. L2C084A000]|uniref:hypothetical protein n=1 Tax=Mesorhizobium sp. L2C084A000 TaxID=1287116 RepID=UPI00040DE91D|nr:hypothetical protein [Mesorhizobium sp. L2C084A000]